MVGLASTVLLLHQRDFSMIVAVSCVRVMEMAVHQVIGVIAMRHGFVITVRSMRVACVVAAALVTVRAVRRVLGAHFQRVLVNVVFMRVMGWPLCKKSIWPSCSIAV